MDFFYITVAALAPIALILAGKRVLGSQTHPAAIFILAWLLCTFILSLAEAVPMSRGILAFVWVAVSYTVITLIRKSRSASHKTTHQGSPEEPHE